MLCLNVAVFVHAVGSQINSQHFLKGFAAKSGFPYQEVGGFVVVEPVLNAPAKLCIFNVLGINEPGAEEHLGINGQLQVTVVNQGVFAEGCPPGGAQGLPAVIGQLEIVQLIAQAAHVHLIVVDVLQAGQVQHETGASGAGLQGILIKYGDEGGFPTVAGEGGQHVNTLLLSQVQAIHHPVVVHHDGAGVKSKVVVICLQLLSGKFQPLDAGIVNLGTAVLHLQLGHPGNAVALFGGGIYLAAGHTGKLLQSESLGAAVKLIIFCFVPHQLVAVGNPPVVFQPGDVFENHFSGPKVNGIDGAPNQIGDMALGIFHPDGGNLRAVNIIKEEDDPVAVLYFKGLGHAAFPFDAGEGGDLVGFPVAAGHGGDFNGITVVAEDITHLEAAFRRNIAMKGRVFLQKSIDAGDFSGSCDAASGTGGGDFNAIGQPLQGRRLAVDGHRQA